jgi:hypothetical protein
MLLDGETPATRGLGVEMLWEVDAIVTRNSLEITK